MWQVVLTGKQCLCYFFIPTLFHVNRFFGLFYFSLLFCYSLKNYHKSWMYKIGSIVMVGHLMLNGVYTSISLYVSHHNYPGGKAMQELHRLIPVTAGILILIACLVFNYYWKMKAIWFSYILLTQMCHYTSTYLLHRQESHVFWS